MHGQPRVASTRVGWLAVAALALSPAHAADLSGLPMDTAAAPRSSPAPTVLVGGADLSACNSALRIGWIRCEGDSPPTMEPGPGPAPAAPAKGTVTEAQIDDYLAHYGKPPRVAVRALLDPSDDNIAALVNHQAALLALADHIAARMTELQRRTPRGTPPASWQAAAQGLRAGATPAPGPP